MQNIMEVAIDDCARSLNPDIDENYINISGVDHLSKIHG